MKFTTIATCLNNTKAKQIVFLIIKRKLCNTRDFLFYFIIFLICSFFTFFFIYQRQITISIH